MGGNALPESRAQQGARRAPAPKFRMRPHGFSKGPGRSEGLDSAFMSPWCLCQRSAPEWHEESSMFLRGGVSHAWMMTLRI